jgi:hypothetical protein
MNYDRLVGVKNKYDPTSCSVITRTLDRQCSGNSGEVAAQIHNSFVVSGRRNGARALPILVLNPVADTLSTLRLAPLFLIRRCTARPRHRFALFNPHRSARGYDSFRCSSNSDQTSNKPVECSSSSATASAMALPNM